MPIKDLVNVQITRETQSISQAGFGTLMILGTHKAFNDRIKYYSSITEVAEDFNSTQLEYIAAQEVFSQSPRPPKLAIGRRNADSVTVSVTTAQASSIYTVTINGTAVDIDSTPTVQESTVHLSEDFVSDNLIKVTLNGTNLGTVTSIINFDADFVASNSIVPTVNGTALSAVPFSSDNATTLSDICTELAAVSEIASATATGANQITVVFNSSGDNTVDSIVTTGGATQPTATISEGGFLFTTDHQTTVNNIKTALEADPNVDFVTIPDAQFHTLVLHGASNLPAVVNNFEVLLGASQAIATITNTGQNPTRESLATNIVNSINAASLGVTATDNADGTFGVTANVAGTPYSIDTSTNIINPISAEIVVTQPLPSTKYSVTISGVEASYTTGAQGETSESIVDNLINAIVNKNLTNIFVSNNNNGSFVINGIVPFSLNVSEGVLGKNIGLSLNPLIASGSIVDDLNAINNIDSDWYALAITDRTSSVVQSVASWTETTTKIFGTTSDDPTIINEPVGTDTTSIAAMLNQLGLVRTFVMYDKNAVRDFPECAWFGKVLPSQPGSVTWKFKSLSGILPSKLSTTQSNNARNKKVNTFEYIGGVGITREGTMAQGEFIDTIRGVDWLTARLQEFVYGLLVRQPKIPYTDAGIASIEAEVRRALDLGVASNFLADNPSYTVSVPLAANVPPSNKALRFLEDVKFQATISGAIHAVQINGTVSV